MKKKTRTKLSQVLHDQKLQLVALGAILLMIGLFLPWYTTAVGEGIARPGLGITTDSGLLIAIFALFAVGSSVSLDPAKPKNTEIIGVVASVLIAIVLLNNYPPNIAGEVLSTDHGYWMGVAGAGLMFLGSIGGIQMIDSTQKRKTKGKKKR